MIVASSTTKRPRVAVVGSIVFDCVAMAERIPRKSETVLGRAFGTFSGGKGANQAVAAARLGGEVFMVGRVGDDARAEFVLDSLRTSGVDTRFVKKDPSVGTGACCIHVDAAGDNSIIIVPLANLAVTPEDVDAARDMLATADVIVCQLEISFSTVAYTVELANRLGVKVILNPAPAGPIPPELISRATIVTPNETEAEFFAQVPLPDEEQGGASPEWAAAAAEKLLAQGPRTVIITLGRRGAFLATGGKQLLVPSFQVTAVDSTAAGDAFNGALAVALAEGRDLEPAIVFANATGALSATRAGAQSSMPTRAEVDTLLANAGRQPAAASPDAERSR
jgi:ribokinase